MFIECIDSVIHDSERYVFKEFLLTCMCFCGSIQRYRYSEAYQVDLRLKSVEQEFITNNSVSEEVLSRMRSVTGWRAGLVVSGLTVKLCK